MAQRLRIVHDGDIAGHGTEVFVEEWKGDEKISSARITEAVTELRVKPMIPGNVVKATVTLFCRSLDIDAELDAIFVHSASGATYRITGGKLEAVEPR